jgi:AAA family ATP:ADP antiporter
MKVLGVTASLFFLPAAILLGAISILLYPGLASGIFIKLSDGSFKHSINKSGVELLSLPIPAKVKLRARAFIDFFVDNSATGMAGLLLILLGSGVGISANHISALIIAFVAAWLLMIVRVRREYVDAFRTAIEKRSIDLDRLTINPEDASTIASLTRVLEGTNERQILFVLQLLEDVHNPDFIPHIDRLLRHPSHEVKSRAIALSHHYPEVDLSSEIRSLTKSPDDTVRAEAIHYLCGRSDDMFAELQNFRDDPDYRVRGSALMCAGRTWRETKEVRERIDLKGMLEAALDRTAKSRDEDEITFMRRTVARIIGITRDPRLNPMLRELLDDDDAGVVKAAVVSAGQTRSPEFIPQLIRFLAEKKMHTHARRALALYGEEVIDPLVERMNDPATEGVVRRRIPGVLALVGSPKSAQFLLNNLDRADPSVRDVVIRALNKLHVRFSRLRLDMAPIEEQLDREIDAYFRLSAILFRLKSIREPSGDKLEGLGGTGRAQRLLISAAEERLEIALERIFRLLGLRYPEGDMYAAFLGVTSRNRKLQADAIEFLDNTLSSRWKRRIIPIVESVSPESGSIAAWELLEYDVPGPKDGIRELIEGDDRWLLICALYFIAEAGWKDHRETARGLVDDPDAILRETSRYYLEKIGSRN